MSNLATATSADREKVATLTKENASLINKLKAKEIWSKSQEAELKCLLGEQGNATPIVSTGQSNAYMRKSYKTKNDSYCWSHGYQVGLVRVIAHEKPDQLSSWDPHGVYGYYLGPALDHYRCYQVHITKIKGTRIVDIIEFFSSKTAIPHTFTKDMASIAALELSNALQNPSPAAPFSHIGTAQLQALHQLSELFSASISSRTAQQAPPVAKTSSQFRSTVC
jgi:hypothetical protein